ncbi:hypothetical protein Tco_0013322 [Tanacetum coccineum]
MKEILQQWMFEDNSYNAHEVHNDLYEALQKSLELDYSNQRLDDQDEARKKKRKKRATPRTPFGSPPSPPPPPPPLAGASGALGILGTSGSSQLPPPPPPPSIGASGFAQQADNSLIQDDTIPDEQVHLSDDEDSRNDHLPKADSRQDWWKALPEEKRPATPEPAWTIPFSNTRDMTTFMKWYCRQVNKTTLTQVDFKGANSNLLKAFYLDDFTSVPDECVIRCHVTIQPQFFFNKDLEYLRYGSKESNPAITFPINGSQLSDFSLNAKWRNNVDL